MPFSQAAFFELFAQYNTAVWPLPVLAYVSGFLVLGLALWPSRRASIAISLVISLMWVVNAIGYHWIFFAQINPTARVFAAVFVVEAMLIAAAPLLWRDLRFSVRADFRTIVAGAAALFAMLAYPLWGMIAGHAYPAMPVFGIAPCPTTIFTIGILLLGNWSAVRWLLIIPAFWSAVGGSAAFLLGVPQDYGLIVSLILLVAIAVAHLAGYKFARHGTV